MCSLSESAATRLALACAEDFVNHNKSFLTKVFPNSSRVDSSNFNPQDFWNCGCQLGVYLHLHTLKIKSILITCVNFQWL